MNRETQLLAGGVLLGTGSTLIVIEYGMPVAYSLLLSGAIVAALGIVIAVRNR